MPIIKKLKKIKKHTKFPFLNRLCLSFPVSVLSPTTLLPCLFFLFGWAFWHMALLRPRINLVPPCSGNAESKPLEHQGNPLLFWKAGWNPTLPVPFSTSLFNLLLLLGRLCHIWGCSFVFRFPSLSLTPDDMMVRATQSSQVSSHLTVWRHSLPGLLVSSSSCVLLGSLLASPL